MESSTPNNSTPQNEPLVSVIITTFNRPLILRDKSLKSILGQTYRNIECIVVDDVGAKESAEEIVRATMQEDGRVRYMKGEKSVTHCRNLGISEARGEFICGIDDDDEWEPTFIEETLAKLNELPAEYGAVTTGIFVINETGRSYYAAQPIDQWWALSIGCGYLFRRAVFFEHNIRYDENLITFEDVDLSIQLAKAGYKIWLIDKPLRTYYLPPLNPKKGRASLSNPSMRLALSFNAFYEKDHAVHESVGPQALEWLYLSGGLTMCRGGMMKEGRQFMWKAFRAKPSFYTLFFAVLSLGTFRMFTLSIRLKDRSMRFLRATLIKRTPSLADA